jgi:hypothetical protein
VFQDVFAAAAKLFRRAKDVFRHDVAVRGGVLVAPAVAAVGALQIRLTPQYASAAGA